MADNKPAHIEQALAERAGAVNEEQVRAAEKRLAAAGYTEAAAKRSVAAKAVEKADEDDGDDAKRERAEKAPPQGRRAPGKQQA